MKIALKVSSENCLTKLKRFPSLLEPGETVSGCPGHQAVGREESGQDEGNQHLEDAHVMMIRMVV